VFTDGSVTLPHSSLADLFSSPYERKNSAKGAAAVVLLGSPTTWRLNPPIIIRIIATATEFPGLNAYVMEVLAQCVALSLAKFTPVNYFFTVLMFQKWLDMIKIYLDKYQEIFGYFSLS
jgi:hypothetical protein